MEMALVDNFVANLRRECELRGISQAYLARESRLHPVTVSRIFTKNYNPSLSVCERLAKAAGVRADTLFLEPVKETA